MTPRSAAAAGLVALAIVWLPRCAAAQEAGLPASGLPVAVVDLMTEDGVRTVRGEWRYSDARVVPVDFRAVGADLRPSGEPTRTLDLEPKAGAADFDDSGWPVIAPTSLQDRRSSGRLAFNWYRIRVTIPERVGGVDLAGTTAVFEVVVDDYAEIWVDGRIPQVLGEAGGQYVAGWNARNRVVVGRDVRPGQEIQLAVFGINGPLSNPPANFIWIRSATLDFYAPEAIAPAREVPLEVRRLDPELDEIVPRDVRAEKLASGFRFTEGPVWHPDGFLLFSDPNANLIYRWSADGRVSVFRTKSGYSGADIADYGQPGSNGLTLDRDGRLTINEHGNRRVTRLERNGVLTVLAGDYEGKRLNSPNDLVYKSDGALYFTDPPFGLPKFDEDPRKELPYAGVFRLADGELRLLATDLKGPNGLAFSPDERFLYVGNWDSQRKVVMRYPVDADGGLGEGTVFADFTADPGEDALDGVKVDRRGNVYVSGPGGLWILSPGGKRLGLVVTPEHPHNFAWGDADGSTLYLAARTGLYRVKLGVPGLRPADAVKQTVTR